MDRDQVSDKGNADFQPQAMPVNAAENLQVAGVYAQIANQSPQGQHLTQLQAIANRGNEGSAPIQQPKNETGLPDQLKSGIESLGGFAMDDVRVHYNSSKPAQLQAHAYAQGTEIHIAPGQEKHLAHEAWHVVQQKQGRVKPTLQLKGIAINDDSALETEADVMGAKAMGAGRQAASKSLKNANLLNGRSIQRKISYKSGGIRSRMELKERLLARFVPDSKTEAQVEALISEVEAWGGRPIFGIGAFDRISQRMIELGYQENPISTSSSSKSMHGPQVPSSSGVGAFGSDEKGSSNFYDFAQVTSARVVVWYRGKMIFDRSARNNTEQGLHAEDILLNNLFAFFGNSIGRIYDPSFLKLNFTINNFFCAPETTTKIRGADSCLTRVIAFKKESRIEQFHIYFLNPYGEATGAMSTSIKALHEVGTVVSGIDPSRYSHMDLDPASDSDDEQDDYFSRIQAEESVDHALVESVIDFIRDNEYDLDEDLMVVDGKNWECYIRCILHFYGRIDALRTVIGELDRQGIGIGNGVVVNSEQETSVRRVISEIIRVNFYVEATDAAHGGIARSADSNGDKVTLLLTGAHFSLLGHLG